MDKSCNACTVVYDYLTAGNRNCPTRGESDR
jgi:hypothetical protein